MANSTPTWHGDMRNPCETLHTSSAEMKFYDRATVEPLQIPNKTQTHTLTITTTTASPLSASVQWTVIIFTVVDTVNRRAASSSLVTTGHRHNFPTRVWSSLALDSRTLSVPAAPDAGGSRRSGHRELGSAHFRFVPLIIVSVLTVRVYKIHFSFKLV